jgi:ABC-type transport system involved in cytochrome bd biosynthesis fused ATPase/permease subunit
VEGFAEAVGGGLRAGVGPQEVHDLLAVQAMSGGQGEQLHQGRRLLQPPLVLFDNSITYGDREAAEQLDA